MLGSELFLLARATSVSVRKANSGNNLQEKETGFVWDCSILISTNKILIFQANVRLKLHFINISIINTCYITQFLRQS